MQSLILLTAGSVWLAVLLLDLILLIRRTSAEGRRQQLHRLRPLAVVALGVLLFVGGGWLLSNGWAWAALGTGLVLLFTLMAALLLAGAWSMYGAAVAAVLVTLGAGGLWAIPAKRQVEKLAVTLTTLTLLQPLWLWLWLCIPAVFFIARRNLGLKVRQVVWLWLGVLPAVLLRPVFGLREFGRLRELAEAWRPWLSVALRSALFALLALALAEPRLTRSGERTTVLFLIDGSASVSEDPDPDRPAIDRRARRLTRLRRQGRRAARRRTRSRQHRRHRLRPYAAPRTGAERRPRLSRLRQIARGRGQERY